MGRKEDSKSAIGALHRHVETVDDACYLARGQIDETPENDTLITALQRNRLVYPVDGLMGFQVHGKVRGLFDHVTSRHRYRESHSKFAGLIEDLESAIDSYRNAKHKQFRDTEHFFGEVQEVVMDVMDNLSDTVDMFYNVVSDEFSIVSDIDERIRQTKRCLNDISQINTVFESLGVERMNQWVGIDLRLERLLMKVLKAHVDKCILDLAASSRKLNAMLSKLVKDKQAQRLNNLIDTFSGQFKREPGYRPNIQALEHLPSFFRQAALLHPGGYPDTRSARDEERLIDAAVQALKKANNRVLPEADDSPVNITDKLDASLEETIDPLVESAELFVEALMDEHCPARLTAMEAYEKLGVSASEEDWLLTVMSYYTAQKRSIDQHWHMTRDETVLQPFDGTVYVLDIVFERLR